MAKEKIAVLGSGASGFGVIQALIDNKLVDIEVFSNEPAATTKHQKAYQEIRSKKEDQEYTDCLYKELRSKYGWFGFDLRSNFGNSYSEEIIGKLATLAYATNYGGNMAYWGGNCYPMKKNELADWHPGYRDLSEDYLAMSNLMDLTGADDQLSAYLDSGYRNSPEITISPLTSRILNLLSAAKDKDIETTQWHTGVAHIAFKKDTEKTYTKYGRAINSVIGENIDQIFDTEYVLNRYKREERINIHYGRVVKITLAERCFYFENKIRSK